MASARASDRAYAQLRAEILDGTLPPGVALAEVEQSARIGLSRTPLREALARLAADGLVEAAGGRGVVVAELPTRDVDALFEMRVCLEAEAARLAAAHVGRPQQDEAASTFRTYARRFTAARERLERPDVSAEVVADYYGLIRQFDEAIDVATDNSYLVDALNVVRLHVARVRRRAAASRERLAASAEEHALIADAIAAGDEALAAHAVHVHLHRSRSHFRAALGEDAVAG